MLPNNIFTTAFSMLQNKTVSSELVALALHPSSPIRKQIENRDINHIPGLFILTLIHEKLKGEKRRPCDTIVIWKVVLSKKKYTILQIYINK